MSERAAAGDGFDKHDQGGISILGVDGRRYTVDESTASYFYEIEALVEKDPDTPEAVEERTILAGNALEEAVGFEMALSMDARCSRVMEKFLKACTDDDLVRYLAGVTKEATDFFTMCKSPFGSRVAEFALGMRRRDASQNTVRGASSSRNWTPPSRRLRRHHRRRGGLRVRSPRVSPSRASSSPPLRPRVFPVLQGCGLAGKLKGGNQQGGSFADSASTLPGASQVRRRAQGVRRRDARGAGTGAMEPHRGRLRQRVPPGDAQRPPGGRPRRSTGSSRVFSGAPPRRARRRASCWRTRTSQT